MLNFREGWQSFKEGLDKRHIREYWVAVWGHAWEIWWGAGVIGLVCTGLTLYYAPSRWILGWAVAWVFLVAGYYAWRADHVRLVPRLELGTLHTVRMPTNAPNLERLFVQVLVKCTTEFSLDDCRGQLLRVMKWSNGEWAPTHVDESLDLLWSQVDKPSITLESGVDRRLDVFFIINVGRHIVVYSDTATRLGLASAPSDIFRFDVRVAAKDCPPRYLFLKVTIGEEWDKPVLEKIENEG